MNAGWCNGSTPRSGRGNPGSNPSPAMTHESREWLTVRRPRLDFSASLLLYDYEETVNDPDCTERYPLVQDARYTRLTKELVNFDCVFDNFDLD